MNIILNILNQFLKKGRSIVILKKLLEDFQKIILIKINIKIG